MIAYLALFAAVLGIGWSALFVRWAAVPGPASAFYRVLIAAAVLIPVRALRRTRIRPDRRAACLAIAGGALFAFDVALWNTAVLRTSVATASLLGNTTPIWVGVAMWLFFSQPPRAAFWGGLVLSLAGCAAIVLTDAFRPGGSLAGDVGGDLLAVLASVFFAAYIVTTGQARARMDTLTFSTLAIIGSVVTMLAVCVVMGLPLTGYPPRTWWALVGLGLVSQLAAYFALAYALGHLPATTTSVGLLAQVPLTALLAVPLLDEPLSARQVAGGLAVLAGIYVVNRR